QLVVGCQREGRSLTFYGLTKGVSESPASPERGRDVGVRLGEVRASHFCGIPPQLLSWESDGDGPQQGDLGQRSAVVEARAGLAIRADGIQPVLVMVLTLDPRDLPVRLLVVLHP